MQKIELTPSQSRFFVDGSKSLAFVTGFGGGKTLTGALKLVHTALKYPTVPQGYFAPTFPLVRDIFYPTLERIGEMMDLPVTVMKAEKRCFIGNSAPIICRTMDNPAALVGFEVGDAMVDEFDILTTEKAMLAWRKIKGRMRAVFPDGKPNQIYVTTTPEGFKATYKIFVKEANATTQLIQGSTYENAHNLADGYIEDLEMSYPPELIKAYLEGQFVNLTSGAVYKSYDRHLNDTQITFSEGERLHVGMDFNVLKGSSIIHVIRDGDPVAVGEIFDAYDTKEQVKILKNLYPNNKFTIYPDATGDSRTSSNTTESDIAILKAARFEIKAHNSNPVIKDRVMAMNSMFLNGSGDRRYLVNADLCPHYASCLEQQVYKNGMPDKEGDLDHPVDAAGYLINHLYPIRHRKPGTLQHRGGY